MSKRKGTRYERELFHMFHNTNKFMPLRAAGSGSTTIPSPDLIVGNKNKVFAIECKSLKSGTKYFKDGEINQLIDFSDKFGATPLVAMRFDNKGWYFVNALKVPKTKKGFHSLNLEVSSSIGQTFEELVNKNTF